MAVSKVDAANQIENQLPQANIANNINFRNILINGDMSIAQRGTSTTGVGGGDTYPAIDRVRFFTEGSPTGRFTVSQETLTASDTPYTHGFTKYMKLDCTTADTALTASQRQLILQSIEAQNLTYIKKGSSNAQKLTFSCWIKSNKTGKVTVELYDSINTRQISKTFTIDTADTWEKKIITYEGDTTGTMTNVNTAGIDILMWLNAGTNYTSGTLSTTWSSVTTADRCSSSNINFADSTDNELLTTGWQLEAGDAASDFEFLPQDVNLQRCQRYYQFIAAGSDYSDIGGAFDTAIATAASYTNTTAYGVLDFTTTMRANPSLDQVSGSSYYRYYNANNSSDYFNSFAISGESNKRSTLNNSSNMTISSGQAGWFTAINAASYLALDAEL